MGLYSSTWYYLGSGASVKICHEKDVGFQIFHHWHHRDQAISGHKVGPSKLRPWRPWPVLFGLAMQIFVKTLTGTTITLTVQPDTKIDPSLNFDRFTPSGNHGITLAKILGEASQVVEDVVSAAEKMVEFWKSSEGLAVKQYVEEKVIRHPRNSSGSPDGFHRVRMDSDELVASVDELLIEVSRFFILKAVNRDTAAPAAAKPKAVTVASDSETGDEAQLSQSLVDHMASDSESCDEEAGLSPSLEVEAQTGKAQSHEGIQLSPSLKVDQEMANDAGTCDEEAAPVAELGRAFAQLGSGSGYG